MKSKLSFYIYLLLPPLFARLWNRFKNRKLPKHIWEGIYSSFDQVSSTNDEYYNSDLWVEAHTEEAKELKSMFKQDKLKYKTLGEKGYLSILAATLDTKKLTVIDIGGGLGEDYMRLKANLPSATKLKYTVVETSAVCRFGNSLFNKDKSVNFVSSLPKEKSNVDLIYSNAVLQYIEEYKKTVKKWCMFQPKYIFIMRLVAGKFNTYATCQVNMPGMSTPCWFFNLDEIVCLFEANGYSLVFSNRGEENWPQENFPANKRMGGHPWNLLFKKKE